jgi:SAM-dependent MidA family methyltransferase
VQLPRNDLPAPAADEQAASAALSARLRTEIEAGGAIDFSRFMARALYEPGLGYYSGGRRKFGATGDFVTAPELGPLFAGCLARPCAQVLAATRGDVLEAGAGSGALAADLLRTLERLGTLPTNYFILELSAELRARQRDTLTQKAPQLARRVRWLDALPANGFRGIVLGNELLDAMPVERFRMTAGGLKQLQVGWADERFVWCERTADRAVQERIGPMCLPEHYTSEIGFQAEAWVRSMAEVIEQGVVLLIDYGFPRAEFYHPQRHTGTLMCHYRQRAHADPLVLVGLQDITAHVDFTAIADAGRAAGLQLIGYASQASFLLDAGLEESIGASNLADVRAHLALTQQVKTLTLPHEMGELYKVIALARGMAPPLAGFRHQDRSARL